MPPQRLIGRETVLEPIRAQLRSQTPVLLYGASGIGKTALAATIAADYTAAPGGVLWLRMNHDTPAQFAARIGRAYRMSEIAGAQNPAALLSAAFERIAREKPLLVLDGAVPRELAMRTAEALGSAVPLLIVTEEELADVGTSRRIGRLDAPSASTLFRTVSATNDAADADALAAALNYIPFALVVAAGSVREEKKPVSGFTAALPQTNAASNSQLLALTAAFRPLPPALQGLVLFMGASFTGAASADLLALVSNATAETINKAMDSLLARHLVERTYRYGEPYYHLHPITATFAQTWLRGSSKLDPFRGKMRDTVLAFARKYSRTVAIAHDRLAAEMDNIMAAAQWAASTGDRAFAENIATALAQAGDFVNTRGYRHELLELRALAASSTSAFPAHVAAPAAPAPRPTQTALPLNTADDDGPDDEPDDAIDDELDDEDEAVTGVLPFAKNADDDALDDPLDDDEEDSDSVDFKTALLDDLDDEDLDEDGLDEDELDDDELDDEDSLDDELDDELNEDDDELDDDEDDEPADRIAVLRDSAPSPNPLSGLMATLDRDPAPPAPAPTPARSSTAALPAAELTDIGRMRAALTAARSLGDRRRHAELQMAIGAHLEAEDGEGQYTEALAAYNDALVQYEALNDPAGMLNALEALARLTRDTENSQAAVLHASRGAALAEQLHNVPAQIRLLSTMGDARQQLGELDNAIAAYERALALARSADEPRSVALVLFMLGYAHLDDGDANRAIERWEEALTLFRGGGQRDYEGRVLGGLGTAYGELGRWAEAISFHTSALYIAREVKDKLEEGLQLSNLGYAYVQAYEAAQSLPGSPNPLGQAVLRYRQALHLAYQSGQRENIVSTTVDLVRLLLQSKRHLAIAEMLADHAAALDPVDRDLRRLKERIDAEQAALPADYPLLPLGGTAAEYAAQAYAQLDA
jgi:tetratricopeptide (TPR) repeat protein